MFLAHSNLASVLFDSSASHSFISTHFVKKHSMLMQAMKNPMVVSSPGGDMKANLVCPKVNLEMSGVDFEANLIVINSPSTDVILGMDWLRSQKAVIQCDSKTVSVMAPKGEQIEIKVTMSAEQFCLVSQLKGIPVGDMLIEKEYLDTAPDELQGMSF